MADRAACRRGMDAVTVDIAALDDHIAEIDPDPKPDALVPRQVRIALRHAALNVHSAAHGVDHACKLDQRAVADQLDDAAAVPAIVGSMKSSRRTRRPASVPSSSAAMSRL